MNAKFIYQNDAQLVQSLINGDTKAFQYAFYDKYKGLLIKNAYTFIHKYRVTYEDLQQHLMVKLVENDYHVLKQYDPQQSPFVAWLSTVSYRIFKDFCRPLLENKNNAPILEVKEEGNKHSEDIKDLMNDLKKILSSFEPPLRRKILIALLIEGRSTEDVARRFDVEKSYVYVIKSRAIKDIREQLKDYIK